MDRHRNFEKRGPYRKRKYLGTAITLLVLLFALLLPPIYLAGLVQPLLSWPAFWVRVLVCALWLVILYFIFWILFLVVRRRREEFARQRVYNMFDEALDALDRIAQGDYDVLVEENTRYHYNELGVKINNLAKQLSSMEQMRQDFVSNVSHEIRSPLTSITGFAQLLKKDGLSESERLHYVEVIQNETERMSKLSDSLLRLSMLDSDAACLNPTTFRLDRQVQSVLLAQEPQWAGKEIELDIELEEVSCMADEELLLQVWQNLLQNAVKFTPQGGHIRVCLKQAGADAAFTIKDDGIGISSEDLVHIFERFYKVDKARDRQMGGNGLGLPLAKRIAELHGGQIRVESTPGSGTTFTVMVPLAQAQPPPEET